MCGIAGLFASDRDHPLDAAVVKAMTRRIAHRGPDGEGVRMGRGYGLGHRRLSIVDLASGGQPMATADDFFFVTFIVV